jgi:hypothetical protein
MAAGSLASGSACRFARPIGVHARAQSGLRLPRIITPCAAGCYCPPFPVDACRRRREMCTLRPSVRRWAARVTAAPERLHDVSCAKAISWHQRFPPSTTGARRIVIFRSPEPSLQLLASETTLRRERRCAGARLSSGAGSLQACSTRQWAKLLSGAAGAMSSQAVLHLTPSPAGSATCYVGWAAAGAAPSQPHRTLRAAKARSDSALTASASRCWAHQQ